MRVQLELAFHTDGDFCFDEIDNLFPPDAAMYEKADIEYNFARHDEDILVELSAAGDEDACQWAVRDLLEGMMCGLRTHKYYVIKDVYDLLITPREEILWKEKNVRYYNEIGGNYDGTHILLIIEDN